MKKALITGITGQDGSYLAEFLLEKGYEVHGIIRRASTFNTGRIDHLYQDPHINGVKLFLHYGDIADSTNLIKLLYRLQPDEIYHLAAQSHVRVSFDIPEYTGDVYGAGHDPHSRSDTGNETQDQILSGEQLRNVWEGIRDAAKRNDPVLSPQSVWGCQGLCLLGYSQLPESYGIFACNGILFNHESPRRGETFVTRKITRAAARIKAGLQENLYWAISTPSATGAMPRNTSKRCGSCCSRHQPDDYVIATGETHAVHEFLGRGVFLCRP